MSGGEEEQDSEPSLAVNPSNTLQIAGTSFSHGFNSCAPDVAPIFICSS